MPGKIRYWSFAAVLGAAVVVAVAVLGAQAERQPTPPGAPGERPYVWLDGRGSRLGVMVRDLDPGEAAAASQGGVRIDSVDEDSPASRAGLRAGDVVVEYDGERVRSARQFTRLVQETAEGRSVPLAVLRDGQRQSLSATPEARAFGWSMSIDGDRIRRDVERGLREFRFNPPALDFRLDGLDRPGRAGRGGRLGIAIDTLTGQLAAYFGASEGGALVTSVRADSPAEQAGLKAGDVVTEVNGRSVRTAGDVVGEVARAGDGKLTIRYLRDRKAGEATVTLAPREDTPPRRRVRPATFVRPASAGRL